jgi:hypothetical protein
VRVRVYGPAGSASVFEGEGIEETVRAAKQAAARRVLQQLSAEPPASLERGPPPPRLLPGWRLPDHVQPPLARAERVVFLDLQNQQAAVRVYRARPSDFVVGFLTDRATSTVQYREAPWPVLVLHSQARDCVPAAMTFELAKVLMGDGRREPPAPPLEVLLVSRNLYCEAVRDVLRLDPDCAPRTQVWHIEDCAGIPP